MQAAQATSTNTTDARRKAAIGSLLGTAVGDALGLPYENLSPRRAEKLLGKPDRYRFLFRWGLVSDDTEHSCMVAQSLIASAGDPARFERELARRFKWWFLKLPAGVGRATARSAIRLWLRFPPSRSGVFSAGNGPAMRAPIQGALARSIPEMLELVRRSSRMTHTDPKASYAAIAVAIAAHQSATEPTIDAQRYLAVVGEALPDDAAGIELKQLLGEVVSSVEVNETTQSFAARTYGSKGVSGYAYNTIPASVHSWLSAPDDFECAVTSIIECGGDADSTAAIVGGIVGARVGRPGIPGVYLSELKEWPCTVSWMQSLAHQAAVQNSTAPRSSIFRQLIRNLVFLAIVLVHGFRRLAPPY